MILSSFKTAVYRIGEGLPSSVFFIAVIVKKAFQNFSSFRMPDGCKNRNLQFFAKKRVFNAKYHKKLQT